MNSIEALDSDNERHQLSTLPASDPVQVQTSSGFFVDRASHLLVSQACTLVPPSSRKFLQYSCLSLYNRSPPVVNADPVAAHAAWMDPTAIRLSVGLAIV